MSSSKFKSLFLFLFSILLNGCIFDHENYVIESGNFNKAGIGNLEAGVSTKQSVIKIFGEPQIKNTISETEDEWIYKHRQTRHKETKFLVVLGSNKEITVKEQSFSLIFRDGILTKYSIDD